MGFDYCRDILITFMLTRNTKGKTIQVIETLKHARGKRLDIVNTEILSYWRYILRAKR